MANYSCKRFPYHLTLIHNISVTDDDRRRDDDEADDNCTNSSTVT